MIVVLILTSIVVGMAFSVLSLVQQHMRDIKNNYEQSAHFDKFESKLWLDMNRYPKATFDKAKEELILSSEIDSISYVFYDEFIISLSDTFEIQIENKLVFFDGKIVDHGSIDAIKFRTNRACGNRSIFIYKYNDAAAFMN